MAKSDFFFDFSPYYRHFLRFSSIKWQYFSLSVSKCLDYELGGIIGGDGCAKTMGDFLIATEHDVAGERARENGIEFATDVIHRKGVGNKFAH